ncbi:MAG: ParB/RepB/Spo0J family partition protein [Ruminococcus sp.]|jgi:ParB family chromosome partitioning protein|nr:ParB/RepB/Spo0J family partition protein [Ruminococcus sp.]
MARKSGLGMGLGALFDDNSGHDAVSTIRLSQIEPNKSQPRKNFDDKKLQSLADSISRNGVLQPIAVRDTGGGSYRIIAGERRFRACKMLGLTEIPAVIKTFDERQTAEATLIENLIREDLNPIEEAAGLHELIEKYKLSQEETAKVTGKSRSSVANSLRLLSLPDDIKKMLEDGALSVGHGKILAGIEDKQELLSLAEAARDEKMTVRQLEAAVKRLSEDNKPPSLLPKNTYYVETALSLREILGRKVKITSSKDGKKGKITLDFSGEDDLKAIAQVLANLDSCKA